MSLKSYITITGYNKLKEELHNLVAKDRPEYVSLVTWAASNGDRSENADYQYSKKKLREIDKRIHFLIKKLENTEVVNHLEHIGKDVIYFGATVTLLRNYDVEQTVMIVGQDEINPEKNHISWTSPLAKNLIGKSVGQEFSFHSPNGDDTIEVVNIVYIDNL